MNTIQKCAPCSVALLALSLGAAARAQSIPIGDHGFEAANLSACAFIQGFGTSSAWEMESGAGGAWRPQTCWDMFAPEGIHVAYINGGTIKQTLTTNAVAGGAYTLSVLLGRRNHGCCPFSPTTLSLWAGTRLIGSRLVAAAEAPALGQWGRFGLTTTAPNDLAAGLPLIVRFAAAGSQTDFDDATLEGGGCPADFDHDGFVTGDDFDQYVNEFTAGNTAADFNGDGFVTGDDFDGFVVAFEAGC